MENFLKYGDLILFHHRENPISVTTSFMDKNPSQAGSEGIFTSFGFIDNSLMFQTIADLPTKQDLFQSRNTNFHGLENGAFQITPRLNFDFHSDYNKTMDFYAKVNKALTTASGEEKDKLLELQTELGSKLEKLQTRIQKELLLNFNILKEKEGQVVTYGSEIQIMHCTSGAYIDSTNIYSKTKQIGYECQLSNSFSEGMIFEIMPRFKSRQSGDIIQIRDEILLRSIKNGSFINRSYDHPIFEDFKHEAQINPFLPEIGVLDPLSSYFKIFCSEECEMHFKIILYRKLEDQQEISNLLCGGDLVSVTHTEIGADLNSDISYSGSSPEVYLRKYKGEYKEEKRSLRSFWFLEHSRLDSAGGRFELSYEEETNKFCTKLTLRHFLTGRMIEIRPEGGSQTTCLAEAGSESYTAFMVEPVVKTARFLQNKQACFVLIPFQKEFLRYKKDKVSFWIFELFFKVCL